MTVDCEQICVEKEGRKGDSCVAKSGDSGLDCKRRMAGFALKTGHFGGRGVRFLRGADGESLVEDFLHFVGGLPSAATPESGP